LAAAHVVARAARDVLVAAGASLAAVLGALVGVVALLRTVAFDAAACAVADTSVVALGVLLRVSTTFALTCRGVARSVDSTCVAVITIWRVAGASASAGRAESRSSLGSVASSAVFCIGPNASGGERLLIHDAFLERAIVVVVAVDILAEVDALPINEQLGLRAHRGCARTMRERERQQRPGEPDALHGNSPFGRRTAP